MNPNLFLILHKVRGEPAFDIGEAVLIDGEEAWIIPTSGHRAYPCDAWGLEAILNCTPKGIPPLDLPKDLPDHYREPPRSSKAKTISAAALLAELGFGPKPMKRRKI